MFIKCEYIEYLTSAIIFMYHRKSEFVYVGFKKRNTKAQFESAVLLSAERFITTDTDLSHCSAMVLFYYFKNNYFQVITLTKKCNSRK